MRYERLCSRSTASSAQPPCPHLSSARSTRASYAIARAQAGPLRYALYTADTSWSKTFVSVVTGLESDVAEVKQILADFDNLLEWLQAFRVLKPMSDTGVSSCFVARLKKSEYELDDDLLATKHLYACNCETFVYYELCAQALRRQRPAGWSHQKGAGQVLHNSADCRAHGWPPAPVGAQPAGSGPKTARSLRSMIGQAHLFIGARAAHQ